MHYVPRQIARWRELMKVDPAPKYLDLWALKIQASTKLDPCLAALTFEKLAPLFKEGNKQKQDAKPVDRVKDAAALKAAWERVMIYPPNPWHLALLQRLVDKELNIDGYFQEVDTEALIDIIREVADGGKPKADAPAQPRLNLPESK